MKIGVDVASASLAPVSGWRVLSWADFAELCKARLTTLVLLTTAAGYAMTSIPFAWLGFLQVLLGTGLVASAAAVLNQWIERDVDGRMKRTASRPLPGSRVAPSAALWLGLILAVVGLGVLGLFSGWPAMIFALATMVIYLVAYTPLKQCSAFCTLAGAVSGALPPVIGAVAGGTEAVGAATLLFLVLFLWQIPHFHAIAWLYRSEYECAGLVMIPRWDRSGRFTAVSAAVATCGLLILPILGWQAEVVGFGFVLSGCTAALGFFGLALQFTTDRTERQARRLFLGSILYLPIVLVAAVVFAR